MVSHMTAITTRPKGSRGPAPTTGNRHLFGVRLEEEDAALVKKLKKETGLRYQDLLESLVRQALRPEEFRGTDPAPRLPIPD